MTKGANAGKILRVNMTDQTSRVEHMEEDFYKTYVGGALLGAKILFDETKPNMDPLSEENLLIYASGPLTGTETPCASRLCIITKSPLTGTITTSLSGGYFPVELKRAGYDAVVISGKAPEPMYLYIKDDKVSFRKASQYWGLNIFDTQVYIKEALNDQNIRISCIGAAGENLSLMAAIMNEARAAGRKGVGAVMGSKNLKAVAVRGTQEPQIHDEERFKEAIKRMNGIFRESPMVKVFGEVGSTVAVEATNALGVLPAFNWQNNEDVDWNEKIGPEAVGEYKKTRNPCYRCPIACTQVRVAKNGTYAGIATEGPEYEALFSIGSMIGVKSAEFTIVADRLCDELGIDVISAGCTVAYAMELYQRGILTETDGLDLTWGNEEAILEMIQMLAYRQGFASVFSDGTKKAAEKLGKGSEKYTLEVKGLELPAYDVRGLKSHGLNFATCFTGADHNKGYSIQEVFGTPIPYAVERFDVEGKGKLTKFNQDFAALYDIVNFCEFPAVISLAEVFQELIADIMSAATGIEYSEEDCWVIGERLNNLCRMYNIRDGFGRKDDSLPDRIKNEPLKFGASKGQSIPQKDLDFMLNEYYEARGWTNEGVPTDEKLRELDLEFTIK